jgi:MSHA biogenesis protein MshK
MNKTRTVLAAAILCQWLPAWGQKLADPTRPPPEWVARQAKGGTPAQEGTPEAPSQLQSLILGGTRKYAIIDGQLVGVGDKINDARVVSVTSAGVILRSEKGAQTLKLFPDVDKRVDQSVQAGTVRVAKPEAPSNRTIELKESK